jgi:hypothetical protein
MNVFVTPGLAGLIVILGTPSLGFSATPQLQIPKLVIADDEMVRFIVGVVSDEEIPEELQQSLIVHVVRPDGSKSDEAAGWAKDGDTRRGFMGGYGLGPAPHPVGRYFISVEFAGVRTPEQYIDVIRNPFAGRIKASWIFLDSAGEGGTRHVAKLRVENRTGRTVRFVDANEMGHEVSISVKTDRPPSGNMTFVRESSFSPLPVSHHAFEEVDWTNYTQFSMVEVADGQTVEKIVILTASRRSRLRQNTRLS